MDALKGVRQLKGNSIDLINIDPPYVGVVSEDWDKENVFTEELVVELHRVLKSTGSIYVWCGIGEKSRSLLEFIPILDKKFKFKDLVTWKKQRGIGMRKGWLYTREELLWYVKDNKKFIWNKEKQYHTFAGSSNASKQLMKKTGRGSRITNVWSDITEPTLRGNSKYSQGTGHITPKPVEAIKRTIELHTKEGDTVLDCFMGSGTTAVACLNTNRNYIGFELEKEYYDLANKRIKEHKERLL